MKKVLLFSGMFLVSIFATKAQLFYTDFATTPANIASLVGTADVTLSDPTNGTSPDWSIAGHSSNKLAKNTQGPFSAGVTTLSATGRLGLGGAAGYFLIKDVQGPFEMDLYWGSGTAGRSLVTTLGAGEPAEKAAVAASTVYKETITYDGSDKIDVKVGCKGGGIYVYDVLISALVVSIDTNNVEKVVASVSYFNILGKPVSQNAVGLVIKKIVYEDGSIETVKEIVRQ